MSDERCMVCGLPVMECLQGITKFLLAQQQEEDYPPQAIPDTARRILDIGKPVVAQRGTDPQPVPITHKYDKATRTLVPVATPQQPVDERAAGIARAVANLSNHEHRLGASRWEP
jgi:hypothetical protein